MNVHYFLPNVLRTGQHYDLKLPDRIRKMRLKRGHFRGKNVSLVMVIRMVTGRNVKADCHSLKHCSSGFARHANDEGILLECRF